MNVTYIIIIFLIGVLAILVARYVMAKYEFFTASPVSCSFKTLGTYSLTTNKSSLTASGANGLIYIPSASSLTWNSIAHTGETDTSFYYVDFTPLEKGGANVKSLINNVMSCNKIPEFGDSAGVNTKTALILCLQSIQTPSSRVFFVKCFVPYSDLTASNVIVGEKAGSNIYTDTIKPVTMIQGASGTPNLTDTYTLSYSLCVANSRPEGFLYTDCCSNLNSDKIISLVSATYYPILTTINPTGADNIDYKDNMNAKISPLFTSTSKTVTIPFTFNTYYPGLQKGGQATSGDPSPGNAKKLNIKYKCGTSSTVLEYTSPSETSLVNIVLDCSSVTSVPMTSDDLKTKTVCDADRIAAGKDTKKYDWTIAGDRDPNCKKGKKSLVTGGNCTGFYDTYLYKSASKSNNIDSLAEAKAYLKGSSSWYDGSGSSGSGSSGSGSSGSGSSGSGSSGSGSSGSGSSGSGSSNNNDDDDEEEDDNNDDSSTSRGGIWNTHSHSHRDKNKDSDSSSKLSDKDIAKLKGLLSKNTPNDFSFPQMYYNTNGGSGSLKPGLSDCQKYYNCQKNEEEEGDYEGQCM